LPMGDHESAARIELLIRQAGFDLIVGPLIQQDDLSNKRDMPGRFARGEASSQFLYGDLFTIIHSLLPDVIWIMPGARSYWRALSRPDDQCRRWRCAMRSKPPLSRYPLSLGRTMMRRVIISSDGTAP
jgi:hypothetical protein